SLTSVGTEKASITAKPVTGSFKTPASKVYDGTADAAVTDRSVNGTINGDDVSLLAGIASFADKKVGANKTVTLAGAALAGTDADNYLLTSVGTEKADITAKPITGNFTIPASRVYDGTADATVTNRSLNGTISGDAVSLDGGTASFADKSVGNDKTVTLTGASLAGSDADNYSLTSVGTEKASIT